MRITIVLLVFISLSSCKKDKSLLIRDFKMVKIETVLQDSLLNVRALEIVKGEVLVATSKGKIYVYTPSEDLTSVTTFEWMEMDTIKPPNYRSIAYTENTIFALGISSPALMYRNGRLVYKENHPKAFYDSMDFWNDQEGIAIGDPTDDCMSIIITRDGGNTWNKLSCNELPKAKEGEAAFAASDTNISIVGDNTWVATGGKASRVLFSPDKGKTWKVYDTPIIQGTETTGMYSIDFYDELNGFAIGGDYTKPNDNAANKIRTKDGGKTWQVVAKGENPGYRSCVQYIPNREGKELVTIGFKGIDYSNASGLSWKHLSDEGFYTLRFLNDSVAYAAGKGRISKLTFRE